MATRSTRKVTSAPQALQQVGSGPAGMQLADWNQSNRKWNMAVPRPLSPRIPGKGHDETLMCHSELKTARWEEHQGQAMRQRETFLQPARRKRSAINERLTSAVLCSGGCALLAVSSLLAIVTIFLPSGGCERRICTLAGYMQMAAVFIMAAGLLVYPFGLNSSLVRSFCGESDIYYAGECQIGWGYMLAIVGVMLTVFLPFFAKYAPKEQLSPTPLPTLL
ncbi:hypothetical protein fugu_008848 [Takifugu bimaculatus]|uniref:Transmembrane protein 211 n=1 Tax=Takifugu bimaculatus TaxID=433685 RepID=A0A4Z2B1B5_9TELE|nr:hypothetical protein fugu_008848 [Takifugu bimaculatus]